MGKFGLDKSNLNAIFSFAEEVSMKELLLEAPGDDPNRRRGQRGAGTVRQPGGYRSAVRSVFPREDRFRYDNGHTCSGSSSVVPLRVHAPTGAHPL